MKRWQRMVAVVVAAGAVVAASGEVADARPPVPVKARTVHPVTAPDTMRPGLVRLRNVGAQPLLLFRKRHSGVPALVRDVNGQFSETGVGRLYRQFHAVAAIDPHSDAYVRLRKGTYYLFSAVVDRIHADDVHVIDVQGTVDNAKAPHARAVTVQLRTNALFAPHVLHAGRFLHFRNRTHRTEELVFFPLSPTATAQQIQDFLAAPSLDKLFGLIDPRKFDFAVPALTGGGEDLYVHSPRHAGRYIAVAIPLYGSQPVIHRHAAAVVTVV